MTPPRKEKAVTTDVGIIKSEDHGWFWVIAAKMVIIMWIIFITCFLPWAIWVTKSIFASGHHLGDVPHAVQPVEANELMDKFEAQSKLYSERDRENSAEHYQILLTLESIKGQVEGVADKVGVIHP